MKKSIGLIVLVCTLLFLFMVCTFTVREDEVAIIRTLGDIKKIVVNKGDIEKVKENLRLYDSEDVIVSDAKGLNLKIPFVQSVEKYTSKLLTYTSRTETTNTKDERRIDIQMYAQYKIVDPAKFSLAVGSKSKANQQLDNRVYSVVIQSANTLEFDEFFLKDKIEELIDSKKEEFNKELIKDLGIKVIDIGINRKNFPLENIQSIEEKMSIQIEKQSQKLRAEGDSYYLKKKAEVDRERIEQITNAQAEAAEIKAEGDKEGLKIYQEALGKEGALDFYKFIKRMEAYKDIDNTTIFLDNNNEFIEYINGYRQ